MRLCVYSAPQFAEGSKMRPKDSEKRKNLALQILNSARPIKDCLGGIFEVPSITEGGKYYTVNLNRLTCECPDWRKRKRPCKHIWAARMFRHKIEPGAEGALVAHSNPYKNPPYYDRLRRARKPCVRELLRCAGVAANRG